MSEKSQDEELFNSDFIEYLKTLITFYDDKSIRDTHFGNKRNLKKLCSENKNTQYDEEKSSEGKKKIHAENTKAMQKQKKIRNLIDFLEAIEDLRSKVSDENMFARVYDFMATSLLVPKCILILLINKVFESNGEYSINDLAFIITKLILDDTTEVNQQHQYLSYVSKKQKLYSELNRIKGGVITALKSGNEEKVILLRKALRRIYCQNKQTIKEGLLPIHYAAGIALLTLALAYESNKKTQTFVRIDDNDVKKIRKLLKFIGCLGDKFCSDENSDSRNIIKELKVCVFWHLFRLFITFLAIHASFFEDTVELNNLSEKLGFNPTDYSIFLTFRVEARGNNSDAIGILDSIWMEYTTIIVINRNIFGSVNVK